MPILTRQHRPFPTSGNTLTKNANPLSSRIGYDLVQGCNNLHYTMPFAGYAAAPMQDGTFYAAITTAGGLDGEEFFVAQVPTVVPDGMARFCWTWGFYAAAFEGSGTYSIDEVNVYISPNVYKAETASSEVPNYEVNTAFDPTALGGNYGLSTYDTPISLPALDTTEVYTLVDMSAGTTGQIVPFDSKLDSGTSWLNRVNLTLTMKATRAMGNTSALSIRAASMSWWWLME